MLLRRVANLMSSGGLLGRIIRCFSPNSSKVFICFSKWLWNRYMTVSQSTSWTKFLNNWTVWVLTYLARRRLYILKASWTSRLSTLFASFFTADIGSNFFTPQSQIILIACEEKPYIYSEVKAEYGALSVIKWYLKKWSPSHQFCHLQWNKAVYGYYTNCLRKTVSAFQ